MMQALDLARENVALREEVSRLRKELAGLVRTDDVEDAEQASSPVMRSAHEPGQEETPRASTAPRLTLVVPRRVPLHAGLFAGLPRCRVIIDRRVKERRSPALDHGGHERRRGDRRSLQPEVCALLVTTR
jgi:hypothetical protein